MSKSVILLSGGLDSTVSLAKCIDTVNLALFFNYGQKSFEYEKIAVEKICDFYNIKLEIIDLNWLKNITNTSLVNNSIDIANINENMLDNIDVANETMKNVWVPNRNALFLNIAASYADSLGFDNIIIGANAEEAKTFSDNSKEFIDSINNTFKFSTLVHPTVIAPLINLDKYDIIKLGKELNVPFNLIRSCYANTEKHCGKCESCLRLKRGLESLGLFDILKVLFN